VLVRLCSCAHCVLQISLAVAEPEVLAWNGCAAPPITTTTLTNTYKQDNNSSSSSNSADSNVASDVCSDVCSDVRSDVTDVEYTDAQNRRPTVFQLQIYARIPDYLAVIDELLQQTEDPHTVATVETVLREQYKRVQLTDSHRDICLAKLFCRHLHAFTHEPDSSSISSCSAVSSDSYCTQADDAYDVLDEWRQALLEKAQQATVQLHQVRYYFLLFGQLSSSFDNGAANALVVILSTDVRRSLSNSVTVASSLTDQISY
jgi:hypothetical protein